MLFWQLLSWQWKQQTHLGHQPLVFSEALDAHHDFEGVVPVYSNVRGTTVVASSTSGGRPGLCCRHRTPDAVYAVVLRSVLSMNYIRA